MIALGIVIVAVFVLALWVEVRARRRDHALEYARYVRELDDRAAAHRRRWPRTDSTGPG